MSDLATVAVNALVSNPAEFLMGPGFLPLLLLLTFTVGIVAWNIAGFIEAKFNK